MSAVYDPRDRIEAIAERMACTYYMRASDAERECAVGTVCGNIDPDCLARYLNAMLFGDALERIKASAALRAMVNDEAMPKLRKDARAQLAERVGDAWVDQELPA